MDKVVIDAINSELKYQEKCTGGWDNENKPSFETELLLLHSYVGEAIEIWRREYGHDKALHQIRKVAGICARCMDTHGAPLRETITAAQSGQLSTGETTNV